MNKLDQLENLVRETLADLGPEPEPWVPKKPGVEHDALIVGAGQSGTAAAFALRRQGVGAQIIDAAREGSEGVWLHRARMPTLRTPKKRPGPELGIAPLAFKAWYTALHGTEAYDEIVRVPRTVWAEYLSWFRTVLNLPVRFETRLLSVSPGPGAGIEVTLEHAGRRFTQTTRKLILATGLVGGGALNVPEVIADRLPQKLYAHTDQNIDFESLKGKEVAILGASASGFDAAATALEAGAAGAHLFCRAPDLARGTRYRWADYPGADFFHLLPDEDRWRTASLFLERGNHPPPTSIARAAKWKTFHLHLGAPWDAVQSEGGKIQVRARGQTYCFDFVIAATGFTHDPTLSPELRNVSADIALWQDRYTPPRGSENNRLARYPYLGPEFQYQEKIEGTAPHLANIHVINTAALLSHLRIVGDIKCLGYVSERLASAIVRDLFLADREAHLERLSSPIQVELTGEEYQHLLWPRRD
ncbi:MAG: hypothetical protein RLZ98_3772 [Pseudomonadota bacterium]|jgi:cation diffusion facilitator CzcD-associated flavoprotein CzcO